MVVTGIVGETFAFRKLKKEKANIEWKELLNNINQKDYDIISRDKKIKVQVKTVKNGNWSLNAEKFLEFDEDLLDKEKKQRIINSKNLDEKVNYFIFVKLEDFREEEPSIKDDKVIIPIKYNSIKYYIIDTHSLQEIVKKRYQEFLNKHNSKRPRNENSFHTGVKEEDLKEFENKWNLIK